MVFGGENAESYYDDGLTALMKGDVQQAIACFRKAIALNKFFWPAYHQLARCALRTGHASKACELLTHVIKNRPEQVVPVVDMGFALLVLGKREEARQYFALALQKQSANPRALVGLAQCAFDEGNWKQAKILAQQSLEHSDSQFQALLLLGKAAFLTGDLELSEKALKNADALIEKSIELNPEQPGIYFFRGEIAYAREHYADALEYFLAAADRAAPAKLYSAFGEYFVRSDILAKLGNCYRQLGQPEKAREMAEQALQMDPENRLAKSLLE